MRKGQHFARTFKRAVAVEYLQSGEERKVIIWASQRSNSLS